MPRIVELEATLRQRNQLTLPAEATEELNARPGDRLVVHIDREANQVVLRPLRRSYRGTLRGAYGTPEQVAKYVAGERAAWD